MVTVLEKLAARAVAEAGGLHPCAVLGHEWAHIGGCNAGCDEDCVCSVPVHECKFCDDCDYGGNDEADEIRARCSEDRYN